MLLKNRLEVLDSTFLYLFLLLSMARIQSSYSSTQGSKMTEKLVLHLLKKRATNIDRLSNNGRREERKQRIRLTSLNCAR